MTIRIIVIASLLLFCSPSFSQMEMEATLDSAKKLIEQNEALRAYLMGNQALRMLEEKPFMSMTDRYETYLKYLSVVQEVDSRISNADARKLFYQQEYQIYEKAIDIGSQIYYKGGGKYIDDCFQLAERNKNVLFLQTLRGYENKEDIPKTLLKKEGDFIAKMKILNDSIKFYQIRKNDRYRILEDTLNVLEFDFYHFQQELKEKYPSYANNLARKAPLSVQKLVENLDEKQAFVEFFYGDEWIYVFLFTKKDQVFKKIATSENVKKLIEAYKNTLHHDEMAFAKTSHELYQTLFKYISKYLTHIEKLSIVTDGALSFIPFEALVTQEVSDWDYDFLKLKYLIYQYQINYYQSAAAFLHLENTDKPKEKSYALGLAPLFTEDVKNRFPTQDIDSSYLGLNPLIQSKDLLTFIKKKFKTEVFTGQAATLQNFQSYKNASLIHLATHTLVDDAAPLQSKIALARSDENDLGYLFLKDLYKMDLAAELVVLGSCETGRGEFNKGEGVVSLAYGFDLAGAESTVYSLWAVDETATTALMRYFYYFLSKGWDKDKALHQAKLKYLQSADEISAAPFYWAGFVLNGKTTHLQNVKRRSKGWFWIIVIVVVFPIIWFLRKTVDG